ncbi:MAG: RibD family protein [Aquisalimonadaceae bacterium]
MAKRAHAPSVIDETAAWELILQARRVCPGARVQRELTASGNPAPRLRVHCSGAWESDASVTDEAALMLDLYIPLCVSTGRAMVVAQMGQSVDGRIATASGHSHYITGSQDILHLHRLRALCDAVVIGAGTAIADNPRLTVRHANGRSPVRVLIDPRLRVGPDRHLFQDAAAHTLVLFDARSAHLAPARREAVEWLPVTIEEGGVPPQAVLACLAERGLHRVLVEGGGQTVSRFLQAGVLDRLHVTVAPLIIGSGRLGLTLPQVATLDEALRPACRRFHMGEDVLFDFGLRQAAGHPADWRSE